MGGRLQTGIGKLPKSPTGINGLDEITMGGLPRNRITLVCGNPGSGKTMLGMEFLVNGIVCYNEPGAFISFEENCEELVENFASLGTDISALLKDKGLFIDSAFVDHSEIEESGSYNLEGLFIRIAHAIDSVGAKRVVLDTIEAIFGGIPNEAIIRSELKRLFDWLKLRNVTTIVTGEKGINTITRYGLEEYISDCVIIMDNRLLDEVSTRRIYIAKYRGSSHGTSEYPFLIDDRGISVLPLSSVGLEYPLSNERISSGISGLDAMLENEGFFRGSTVLVSGTAGTGKTSLASCVANSSCERGEECLYLAYEESGLQITRNMASIGLDLQKWVDRGMLRFHAARPSHATIEYHLAIISEWADQFKPKLVIIDPISSFLSGSNQLHVQSLIIRLIDMFKVKGITTFFTHLTRGGGNLEETEMSFSSIVDTWIVLKDFRSGASFHRGIYVLKSRGMNHCNDIMEYHFTPNGIKIDGRIDQP